MAAPTTMKKSEREAFLAGVHVGVLAVADGKGVVAVPIWYAYEPGGDVRVTTGARSLKAGLLRAAGRAAFCVQDERAPYKYVTVEGPATVEPIDFARDVVGIAERYLGVEGAKGYLAGQTQEAAERDNIVVRIRPERWRTCDYGKLYGGS